jgi:Domain of unknown function (DUF3516)
VEGGDGIAEPAGSHDITRDEQGFTVLIRNEMFRLMRALARREYAAAAEIVDDEEWNAKHLEETFRPYFEEHASLRVDPPARSPKLTKIEKRETTWEIEQILLDPEEANDWLLACTVDLARAREAGRPLLKLRRAGT